MKETSKPCDTCAFRDGCETQDEPHNVLRSMICVATPLPFHCHHAGDTDYSKLPIPEVDRDEALAIRRTLPICEGWRRQVAARARAGRYPRDPETRRLRRWLGTYALQMLNRFVRSDDQKEKDHASGELISALTMLKDR